MDITSKTWKAAAKRYRELERFSHKWGTEKVSEARRWARKERKEANYWRLYSQQCEKDYAELDAENKHIKFELRCAYNDISSFLDKIEQLEADNARLRELIKSVEWVNQECSHCHWTLRHNDTCPAFNPDGTVK